MSDPMHDNPFAYARAHWDGNPHAIHKRPPFSAHSFDDDGRFFVVGSTCISVIWAWHGPRDQAERIAAWLNDPSLASPQT